MRRELVLVLVAVVVSAILLFCAEMARAQTVTVDGSVEHQTIEGIGGAMESHPQYEDDAEFWDIVFDEVGVSSIQFGTNDFVANYQLEVDELFPTIREAWAHGVRLYAAITSPKAEWKDTGHVAGGTLLPEHYSDYAQWALDYLDHIKAETGVDVTHYIPFPEPNWIGVDDPDGPWPYCYMTADKYRDYLKVMGPLFRAARPDVTISAPCGNRVPVTSSYANTILSDPDAARYVDMLSSNGYEWPYATNSSSWQSLRDLSQQHGMRGGWVPEVSHWIYNGQMPAAHQAGLYTVKWIYEAHVHGNVSIYHWICMLDFGQYREAVRGLFYSKEFPPGEFSENGITKVGYAFRQFARWVRPGAVRIEAASSDPHVLIAAYKHPVQNTVTLVAINDDTSERTVTFTVDNIAGLTTLEAHRTSIDEDGLHVGDTTVTDNSFTFALPPESTTTFAGDLSGTCVPDCTGRECGDDGCAGFCGVCDQREECIQGRCVCMPDCEGSECGPDGCGGTCGGCGQDQVCDQGSCKSECTPGLTMCGQDCVDLDSNPGHCGKCDHMCAGGEICTGGYCVTDCKDEICGRPTGGCGCGSPGGGSSVLVLLIAVGFLLRRNP